MVHTFMNNIDYLINAIKREVPPEILEYGLCSKRTYSSVRPSVNHLLSTIIIKNWVGVDINLLGGVETSVNLRGAKLVTVQGGTVLEIPMSATQGREITSVLSLQSGTISNYGLQSNLVDAISPSALAGEVRVQLIGPNAVFVEGNIISTGLHLRCILENENNLGNLSPRVLPLLAKLCVMATRAHIYNTSVIRLDSSAIIGGIAVGQYSDIVNGWADANEIYNDLLYSKWRKTNVMGDRISNNRYVRMIMPR